MMNAEGRIRLGNTLIYSCAIGLIATSIVKFIQPARAVTFLSFLGYEGDKYFFVAGLELVCGVLFLIRATRPFGLLLVSSYFGGAIAAHLARHPLVAGQPFLVFTGNHPYLSTLGPDLFLPAAWIGAWLSSGQGRASRPARQSTPSTEGREAANAFQ
jgi:hypothetical protein